MTSTPNLIESLTARAAPVRRLRPAAWRASLWLGMALVVVVILAQYHGLRSDLSVKLQDGAFVIESIAALLTGALAAVAAFHLSVPGRSEAWLLLPAPSLVVWMFGVGYGCLVHWTALPASGVLLGELGCLETVVLTSSPLSLLLLILLRHAGAVRPTLTAAMGALAVGALSAAALSVLHNIDATVLALIWNYGMVGLLVALGGAVGRAMFSLVGFRQAQ